MKLSDAERMAKLLMAEYGLDDWRFEFDRAVRRFGACHYRLKKITLSQTLVELNEVEHVEDVILHEIAHALVGYRAGHGWLWKLKAEEIGCSSTRCYSNEVITPPHKWVGICPNGHKTYRRRRDRLSCSRCCPRFNTDYLFEWKTNLG